METGRRLAVLLLVLLTVTAGVPVVEAGTLDVRTVETDVGTSVEGASSVVPDEGSNGSVDGRSNGSGAPSETWIRRYGAGAFYGGTLVDDGSYLVGSGDAGGGPGLVVRTDRSGETLWRRTYTPGDEEGTFFLDAIRIPDRRLLVVGHTGGAGGPQNRGGTRFATLLGANGSVIWQRTYGPGRFTDVASLDGDRAVVTGTDGVVTVVDPDSGDVIAEPRLGNRSVTSTSIVADDGGYLAVGNAITMPFRLRLDASGQVEDFELISRSGGRYTWDVDRFDGGHEVAGELAGDDPTGRWNGWRVSVRSGGAGSGFAKTTGRPHGVAVNDSGYVVVGSSSQHPVQFHVPARRDPLVARFDGSIRDAEAGPGQWVLLVGRDGGQALATVVTYGPIDAPFPVEPVGTPGNGSSAGGDGSSAGDDPGSDGPGPGDDPESDDDPSSAGDGSDTSIETEVTEVTREREETPTIAGGTDRPPIELPDVGTTTLALVALVADAVLIGGAYVLYRRRYGSEE